MNRYLTPILLLLTFFFYPTGYAETSNPIVVKVLVENLEYVGVHKFTKHTNGHLFIANMGNDKIHILANTNILEDESLKNQPLILRVFKPRTKYYKKTISKFKLPKNTTVLKYVSLFKLEIIQQFQGEYRECIMLKDNIKYFNRCVGDYIVNDLTDEIEYGTTVVISFAAGKEVVAMPKKNLLIELLSPKQDPPEENVNNIFEQSLIEVKLLVSTYIPNEDYELNNYVDSVDVLKATLARE